MSSFNITTKRDGSSDNLRRKLELFSNSSVLIGIQGAEASQVHEGDKKITNLDVAVANEFGRGHIPERSFIRASLQANKDTYRDAGTKIYKNIIRSPKVDITPLLEKLGAKASADMKNYMVELRDPPNAPSTIARKKSSNPLIDTGQLKNSITWAVQKDESS